MIAKQPAHGKVLPEKKENTKILKILEAIEKGKAHMCPGPSKETALVAQQQSVKTTTLKPIKNLQNVILQK